MIVCPNSQTRDPSSRLSSKSLPYREPLLRYQRKFSSQRFSSKLSMKRFENRKELPECSLKEKQLLTTLHRSKQQQLREVIISMPPEQILKPT